MAIVKIPDSYVNNQAAWLPLRTVAKKVNEIIDGINAITGGTSDGTFENIEVTDTATIETLEVTDLTSTSISTTSIETETLEVSQGLGDQSTSITTAITGVNGQSFVISTVSSTLASNASATFTVNNNTVTSTSTIVISAATIGAGIPVATVVEGSKTSGAFNVKLYNAGTSAFNAAITINGFVIN